MTDTDPPLREKRRRSSQTATKATGRKTKTPTEVAPEATPKVKPSANTTTAPTVETEAAVEETVEATVDTPESVAGAAADSDTAEAQTPTTAPPPVDPFDYHQSTLTLSLSFLPLVEGATERQVIVSVHSKNGTGKSILPEFMAPLQESDLKLPAPILALIERYRTVTLPKRKTDAEAKAAALAAKQPVSTKRGKDLRPAHVTTGATTKRMQPAGVSTQFKLNFSKK